MPAQTADEPHEGGAKHGYGPPAELATRTARDSAYSLVAEVSKMLSSIITFVLVARAMGVLEYGVYVGLYTVITVISPFATMGSPVHLIDRIRRQGEKPDRAIGAATGMVLVGAGAALLAVAAAVSAVFSTKYLLAAVVLSVAEYLAFGVSQLCTSLALAMHRQRLYSAEICLGSVLRVSAAVLYSTVYGGGLVRWAACLGAGLALQAVALSVVTREVLGVAISVGRFTAGDAKQSIPYAASIAAFTVQDGVDKPILVRAGYGVEAGLYSAAYRIPTMVILPIQAMMVATFARSFSSGQNGLRGSLSVARQIGKVTVAYGVAAGVLLAALAPLLGPVFGPDFDGSIRMVRWLAPLPLLRTVQYLAANALTGSGHQSTRFKVLLGALVLNVALCLALIPRWSWRGASVATLVTEAS